MAKTRLESIMSLIYQMQPEDISALGNALLEKRKIAWMAHLREEAQALGCGGNILPPRGADLRALRLASEADARAIAETWQRDLERQIGRIRQQYPRARRQTWARELEGWANQRATWKNDQIAINTVQTARQHALETFVSRNGFERTFMVIGPPPICPICVGMMGRGEVDEQTMRDNPAPFHPNCPHRWASVRTLTSGTQGDRPRTPCADLWLGG